MEKHFKLIFAGVISVKLILAYLLPITSDEAYFYIWGINPDVNYYDHPPMTGWIMYLFSFIGKHIFVYRLFTIISGIIIAIGIYLIINDLSKNKLKAKLISLSFLATPLNILFVMITTDSPLFLFVFLSGTLFFYGIRKENDFLIFFSGICLGLALLSKYFAGLLIPAFALSIFFGKNSKPTRNCFLMAAGILPFILLHIYWNYNNCWTNLMFNVINRNKGGSITPLNIIPFFTHQLYLATPWSVYFLIKNRKKVKHDIIDKKNI